MNLVLIIALIDVAWVSDISVCEAQCAAVHHTNNWLYQPTIMSMLGLYNYSTNGLRLMATNKSGTSSCSSTTYITQDSTHTQVPSILRKRECVVVLNNHIYNTMSHCKTTVQCMHWSKTNACTYLSLT